MFWLSLPHPKPVLEVYKIEANMLIKVVDPYALTLCMLMGKMMAIVLTVSIARAMPTSSLLTPQSIGSVSFMMVR